MSLTAEEKLIQVREWLGSPGKPLSQAELARRLGVAQPIICRYEAGMHLVPGPIHKLLGLIEHVRGAAEWLEENRDG